MSYFCATFAAMDTNNNIKQLCKYRGLSFVKLAAILGVTRQTLHKQSTGAARLATLERIAAALDVPTFVLIHPEPVDALKQYQQQTTHQEHNNAGSVFNCPFCGHLLNVTTTEMQTQTDTRTETDTNTKH